MATRVISPVTGFKLKVKGKKIAIPVVADIPGTAPNIAPITEPMVSQSKFVGSKTCNA